MKHLNDELLQNYLDGNLSRQQTVQVETHLQTCQKCQYELAQYRNLYLGLKEDLSFQLSPAFSEKVMSALHPETKAALLPRLWHSFLTILGLAAGVGMMIYYVDFKPLLKMVLDSFNPVQYIDISILTDINQIFFQLNLNISLIVLAGLILLMVVVIDYIIFQRRDKFMSYLKMLPGI